MYLNMFFFFFNSNITFKDNVDILIYFIHIPIKILKKKKEQKH